ncbi:MAG: prepilin-type N-terminal cleavage/methylation domain-containing protein [Bacillota bacterium]
MPGLFLLYAKIDKQGKVFRLMQKVALEKGFTLVEVLAAVSVFTMLLGSVFSLYFFGMNTYHAAATRLDLQQNVRLGGDFITRELRHAVALQMIGEGEVRYRLPGDAGRYTIKQKNEEIVLLINNTETKIAYNIGSLVFTWNSTKNILYYTIEGDVDSQCYSVRSAVFIPNLDKPEP